MAAVFPSRYFHAGLDEVDLGRCPRCARRGKGKPKWWIYAEHAKAVYRILRAAGKEMILWADHVERDPAMLKVLPKDIIMAHWHYREIRPEAIDRSLAAGFRVIGCPALCHHGDMIMPNAANFANMDAMTGRIASASGGQTAWAGHDYTVGLSNPSLPGGAIDSSPSSAANSPRRKAGVGARTDAGVVAQVLGIVNTWWTLWRGLRDAYLPAVAYTGAMLSAQAAVEKPAFARRLAARFFGLRSAAAERAIWTLHEEMIDRNQTAAGLCSSLAHLPDTLALGAAWGSNPALPGGAINALSSGGANSPRRKAGVDVSTVQETGRGARHDALASAVEDLVAARAKVARNLPAFDALILSGRIACLCLRRAKALHAAFEHYRRAARGHDCEHRPDDVTAWLGKALAAVDQARAETGPLARAAAKEWDRTRYRDDAKKGLRDGNPYLWDSLVAMLDRAARFDERLVVDLKKAIKNYPKTRRFPGGV